MRDELEILARRDKLLADEVMNAKRIGWFYLSYAGPEGFRGACFIQAFGPTTAVLRANIEGISPGGEVRIFTIPAEAEHLLPDPEWREKLLSLKILNALNKMVNLHGEPAPETKEDA